MFRQIITLTLFVRFSSTEGNFNDTLLNFCQRPNNCKNNICSSNSCTFGCETGYYGKVCTSSCSSGCKDRKCKNFNSTQGHCTEGCKDGFWGDTCSKSCSGACKACVRDNGRMCKSCTDTSYYGKSCNISCSKQCRDTGCDMEGRCLGRCPDQNFKTPCSIYCRSKNEDNDNCVHECFQKNGTCKYGCQDGHYGAKCESSCEKNCLEGVCDRLSGNCPKCKPGFYGSRCVYSCQNCLRDICDQKSGKCTLKCKDGFYGPMCNRRCKDNCKDGLCRGDTGKCVTGTVTYGPVSTSAPTSQDTVILYSIIASGVLLLCCVTAGILLFKFCKSPCCEERTRYLLPTTNDLNLPLPELRSKTISHEYTVINEDELDQSSQGAIPIRTSNNEPVLGALGTDPASNLVYKKVKLKSNETTNAHLAEEENLGNARDSFDRPWNRPVQNLETTFTQQLENSNTSNKKRNSAKIQKHRVAGLSVVNTKECEF